MKEKQKLKNTDDILIAGRHIEFVTGYSLEECVDKLHSIEKGGWYIHDGRGVKVQTNIVDHDSANFEVKHTNLRSRAKETHIIKGAFHAQNDGKTLVYGDVRSFKSFIAKAFEFSIFTGMIIIAWSIDFILVMLILSLILIILIFPDRDYKKLHTLLSITLYTSQPPSKKQK